METVTFELVAITEPILEGAEEAVQLQRRVLGKANEIETEVLPLCMRSIIVLRLAGGLKDLADGLSHLHLADNR